MFPEGIGGFPEPKRPRRLFALLVLVLAVAFAVAGYFLYVRYSDQGTDAAAPTASSVPAAVDDIPSLPRTVAPETAPILSDANYQSENFRIGEIAIGGEAEFILLEDTPDPIAVSGIRGEAFTEKNRPEVKLVLSWKTNKLSRSEVTYSKGVGQPEKTVAEDGYSFNHSIVIPGLDQASTYVYAITAYDRFGGETRSESHAVYTGSKTVSLFDLIAGAVGDVFGWAVKK